jgi:hypothetical protein
MTPLPLTADGRRQCRRSTRRARPVAAPLACLVALVLLVAACGGTPTPNPTAPGTPGPSASATSAPTDSPRPSPTPLTPDELAALFREIEDQVLEERGLPVKERLEPQILTEAEVRDLLKAQFEKENPAEEIAIAEETLRALGLLPADADLGELYVDMLGSQVAGYYDPEAKALFVVARSGRVGATEKVTFAHEFTHALQDQSFGLGTMDVESAEPNDRSLGRLALIEGDATLLMTLWLSRNLAPAELQELLQIDPEAQEQLEQLPAILRETLLFPYQQGLIFVNGIWAQGGWEAVDRAYDRLPESTEQVLHPEKYEAGEKPVDVKLDAAELATRMGDGWSATPEDTLGEFLLSVWLRENGVKALDASAAAAGWGGDRLAYLRGPDGAYGLALRTTWDSWDEAAEFLAAAETAAAELPGAAQAGYPAQRGGEIRDVWVFAASDAVTLGRLATATRG